MQYPLFRERVLDLELVIPGLFWGTVNVKVDCEVCINRPDWTFQNIDWAAGCDEARIGAETFSFVRCSLAVHGRYHTGLIYYPHPETKGFTNEHRFDVLEVLARPIADVAYGVVASVTCRADAFLMRHAW